MTDQHPYDPQQQYGAPPPYEQTPPQPSYAAPGPYAPPTISPSQERTWGTVAHVCALAAVVFTAGLAGFLASLVIYLVYRDKGPFVRAHAANSLNIQIVTFLLVLVQLPLLFVLIGFLTIPITVIWSVVLHVIGAVKANNGEWYQPPLVPRLVS